MILLQGVLASQQRVERNKSDENLNLRRSKINNDLPTNISIPKNELRTRQFGTRESHEIPDNPDHSTNQNYSMVEMSQFTMHQPKFKQRPNKQLQNEIDIAYTDYTVDHEDPFARAHAHGIDVSSPKYKLSYNS